MMPAMPFFVYMLGCRDDDGARSYVGWTTEPERRLAEHNRGTGARSTRGRAWTMIHLEEHPTRRAATQREWHLKRDRRTRRLLMDEWRSEGSQGQPGATDGRAKRPRRQGEKRLRGNSAGAPP